MVNESPKTESSSLPLLLTDTLKFPRITSNVALVRTNTGFNIFIIK